MYAHERGGPPVIATNVFALLDKKLKKSSKAGKVRATGGRAGDTNRDPAATPTDAAPPRACGSQEVETKKSKKASKKNPVVLDEARRLQPATRCGADSLGPLSVNQALWNKTQLTVSSWADCDDEDEAAPFASTPAPASDGAPPAWLLSSEPPRLRTPAVEAAPWADQPRLCSCWGRRPECRGERGGE